MDYNEYLFNLVVLSSFEILWFMRILVGCMCKKKIQSVLVDYQRGIGGTLRVKPLTWGHGSNFGSPGIWVVTTWYQSQGCNNTLGSMFVGVYVCCNVMIFVCVNQQVDD